MTSKDYWEEAALQREQEIHDGAEEAVKKMLRLYDDALDDINGEIKKIKYNFQTRYGLDEETAERYIAQEIRNGNNEKLTRQLLTAGSDEERAAILDFVHRDGLSKRAYGARAERFESLKNVIELRMIQLEYDLRNEGEAARRQAYTDNYYRVIDDTARELNMGVSFNLIDNEALNEVMDRPWHGKRFSQRIWDNTDRLAEEAQEIVGRYIVSGRSLDKAARELADAFEVEKFHATTLIHTEVAHARSVSDMKAYEDIGAEYYRYIATLDEVTCDVCAPLDGQRFRVADAVEGMNYPVMHPRCRCTTGLDKEWLGRAARDPVTGKSVHIDGDLTYAQWRENMSEEEAAAFATAQRKYRNTAADKKQYEKYRELLGKEVPKSFDKFQNLKYNDSEKYAELKQLYREVNWQTKALKNHSKGVVHREEYYGTPYSVFDNYSESGTLLRRRYYGRTGTPRLDIDMTDHNNSKEHEVVPHYHSWYEIGNGRTKRDNERNKKPEKWHVIANKDILGGENENG